MSFKVIEKKDMASFVKSLMEEMEVVGPVAKGGKPRDGKFVFSPIRDYSQLRLDHECAYDAPVVPERRPRTDRHPRVGVALAPVYQAFLHVST